ncbi:DUF2243 domain-containing protein [Methylobacterium sp. ID0610]|uniref:DUF2243 domain-containing protein n=1 Tax=Methylobacterium carpenticola TaxID=3344827 RepID=UPI003688F045
MADATPDRTFPTAAGILFGLGLGGFFDGIVLHQMLQWHHMLSSWYPITSIEALERNTLWDGIFHSATYVFVVLGLFLLWRRAHRGRLHWSGRQMAGAVLLGWGAFNLVEGVIDHQILGIHHVNETAERTRWLAWDLGFLAWGAAMALIGAALLRSGRRLAARP